MRADWTTAHTRHDAAALILRFRGWWGAAAAVVALLALSVVQRVDLALAAAHAPGTAAGGVGDLASPARFGSAERSLDVAAGWAAYQDQLPPDARSVPGLLVVYLAADLILMTAVSILLLLWWARVTRIAHAGAAASDRLAKLQDAVRWVWVPATLYLPTDLVETVLATGQWRDLDLTGARVIAGASVAKWAALLLAAIPLAVVEWLRRDVHVGRILVPLRGQFLVAGLLVAAFLALSGDLGLQVDDILIRAVERPSQAILATLCAIFCGAALHSGGLVRLRAYQDAPGARAISGRALGLCGLTGAALLGLGLFWPMRDEAKSWAGTWHVAAVLGGALLVLALTSAPHHIRTYKRPRSARMARLDRAHLIALAAPWLEMLALVPLLVLSLAITRAATSQAASGNQRAASSPFHPTDWSTWPQAVRMVVWVALIVLFGCVLFVRLRRRAARAVHAAATSGRSGPTLLAAGLAGFVTMSLSWIQVRADAWGAAALILTFSGLLAMTVTGLVWLGDRMPVRGSLAVIGFRRTPVIGLLLVLAALASTVDRDGVYFDAITGPDKSLAAPAQDPLVDPVVAFNDWAKAHATRPRAAGTSRPTVSLVFVAAAGGGIKAAYWTAAGMSCALGDTCRHQDVTDQLFLASGVSGGSLGLAAVRADQNSEPRDATGSSWYDDALDGDFVSSAVAAFLFHDVPNAVARAPWPQYNRARALQDAWEHDLHGLGHPFFQPDGNGPPHLPYLALNGTSVEDGCRLSVSELRMETAPTETSSPVCAGEDASPLAADGPRTYPVRDVAGYLCNRVFGRVDAEKGPRRAVHNLRLSTAALLSARFPYVSPSGDLSRCGSLPNRFARHPEDPQRVYSEEHTYVVDGGLFDNSGATAVSQVWERIAPAVESWNASSVPNQACVVPRLLVLDNHYDPAAAPSTAQRPQQLTAPPSAKDRVYDLRSTLPLGRVEAEIRAGAARALSDCRTQKPAAGPDQSVAVLRPVQRPGSKAPLGWTLSDWSREDMKRQLRSARNQCHVQTVRAWFGEGTARSDCEDADLSLSPSDVPL